MKSSRTLGPRRRAALGLPALVAAIAVACGASDRKVTVANDGGTGSEEGGSSSGGRSGSTSGGRGSGTAGLGSGGVHPEAGTPGVPSGGTDSEPECDPACGDDTPLCEDGRCVACRAGTERCGADETPERCENGEWVQGDSCGGNRPVCSNGTCVAFRLQGGLVSVGAASADGSIRLVDHGFEMLPTLCAEVNGETVCVSGGVRP
jgi:hypothetical protein